MTYVFSDVLRPDGLVARVRGVQRAQEQPGNEKSNKYSTNQLEVSLSCIDNKWGFHEEESDPDGMPHESLIT